MGSEDVSVGETPRLPDDLRPLAQKAANLHTDRPALKRQLVEQFALGTAMWREWKPIRSRVADALVTEGWDTRDARHFMAEVRIEVHDGYRRFAIPERLGFMFEEWDDELKYASDRAPLWRRGVIRILIRPVLFVLKLVFTDSGPWPS